MKKGILLLFFSLLLILPTIISAEEIDLSTMDYYQLCELKQNIETELLTRPESAPTILLPGAYEVGKDIRPGRYFLMDAAPTIQWSTNLFLKIYKNNEIFTKEKNNYNYKEYREIELINKPESYELFEGEIVYVPSKGLALCKTEFAFEDVFSYQTPEGTLVPVGTYSVGDDIPEGTYRVYAAAARGGKLSIYKNMEDAQYGELLSSFAESNISVSPSNTEDLYEVVYLENGKVVVVEKSVVMKKQEKLKFD